ncbi:hypothetical protein DMENIID0001_005030 [Sergentomyia squamirostris]
MKEILFEECVKELRRHGLKTKGCSLEKVILCSRDPVAEGWKKKKKWWNEDKKKEDWMKDSPRMNHQRSCGEMSRVCRMLEIFEEADAQNTL